MTPKQVIDDVIQNHDGLDPADDAASGRIVKYLFFLQQMHDFIHNFREWEFTFFEDTVTQSSGNDYADFPADFMEFGRNGGLWDPARRIRLEEVPRYSIFRMREEASNPVTLTTFAIGEGVLLFPFSANGDTTYKAVFRGTPPVLVYDDPPANPADPDPTTMLIPDKYRYTVVTPALVQRAQQSKQDARPDWLSILRDGLSQMCKVENPVKTSQRMFPLARKRAW